MNNGQQVSEPIYQLIKKTSLLSVCYCVNWESDTDDFFMIPFPYRNSPGTRLHG